MIPFSPSTTKKSAILEMAAEELGSAGYEFDHGPDEIASWLRKLDALMIDWAQQGIAFGYNYPTVFGQGDQNDTSGIPDAFVQTVAIALAVRIMPSWGKSMSVETRAAYARGMSLLRAQFASIPQAQLKRNTPVGSGNRYRSLWRPYAGWCQPCEPVAVLVDADGTPLIDGGVIVDGGNC